MTWRFFNRIKHRCHKLNQYYSPIKSYVMEWFDVIMRQRLYSEDIRQCGDLKDIIQEARVGLLRRLGYADLLKVQGASQDGMKGVYDDTF